MKERVKKREREREREREEIVVQTFVVKKRDRI